MSVKNLENGNLKLAKLDVDLIEAETIKVVSHTFKATPNTDSVYTCDPAPPVSANPGAQTQRAYYLFSNRNLDINNQIQLNNDISNFDIVDDESNWDAENAWYLVPEDGTYQISCVFRNAGVADNRLFFFILDASNTIVDTFFVAQGRELVEYNEIRRRLVKGQKIRFFLDSTEADANILAPLDLGNVFGGAAFGLGTLAGVETKVNEFAIRKVGESV